MEEVVRKKIALLDRNRVKVDFDLNKKVFLFSTSIFSSKNVLPSTIKTFVKSRERVHFRPYKTQFLIEDGQVLVKQEVPFDLGFQKTLRSEVDQFWKMGQKCGQMLAEIAFEECYQTVLQLDSD